MVENKEEFPNEYTYDLKINDKLPCILLNIQSGKSKQDWLLVKGLNVSYSGVYIRVML